jgi:hypothetical protein
VGMGGRISGKARGLPQPGVTLMRLCLSATRPSASLAVSMGTALFVLTGLVGLATPAHAGIADAVHPDFDLTEVPFTAKYKTMGVDFLKDGRMVMAVTDFVGGGEVPAKPSAAVKVLLVSGYNGAAAGLKVQEISNTWLQLVGSLVVQDKIYVSDRDGFYEIPDLTGSAPATNRKLVVKWPDENTWNTSFQWHQFVFTPVYKDGFFYAPYSGSIKPGGPSDAKPTSSKTGAFLKWDLTGKMEAFAGGFRSPNGAGINDATGEMFVADNQGSWLPASTFALMKQGRFYGHRQNAPNPANWAEKLPYEPPVAWLPHGEVRDSPSQPVVIKTGKYAGDWLIGDVDNPGLIRVALDKVGDGYNGAVFFFTKGTKSAAINRMAWGPDGALYMGSLATISGNWPNGNDQAFYRLAPKASGANTFEMKSVRSLSDGLEVEFTQPVNPATAAAGAFSAEQWQYIRQPEYGIGRQPTQKLTVSGTEVSSDGLRVHVKIAGMVADRVVHMKHAGVMSAAGKAAWNDETWFTLNTLASRSWNAVGVRDLARVSLPQARLRSWKSGAGILTVAVEARGAWRMKLVAPNGAILAAQSGRDAEEIRFRHIEGSGIGILKLELEDGGAVSSLRVR